MKHSKKQDLAKIHKVFEKTGVCPKNLIGYLKTQNVQRHQNQKNWYFNTEKFDACFFEYSKEYLKAANCIANAKNSYEVWLYDNSYTKISRHINMVEYSKIIKKVPKLKFQIDNAILKYNSNKCNDYLKDSKNPFIIFKLNFNDVYYVGMYYYAYLNYSGQYIFTLNNNKMWKYNENQITLFGYKYNYIQIPDVNQILTYKRNRQKISTSKKRNFLMSKDIKKEIDQEILEINNFFGNINFKLNKKENYGI